MSHAHTRTEPVASFPTMDTSGTRADSVTYHSLDADVSAGALWARFDRVAGGSLELRELLGLPIDRPIVMTGHQPMFWHPGILAKYHAAQYFAERAGAAAASVIVDIDAVDPFAMRLPESVDATLPRAVGVRVGPEPLVGQAAERLRTVADPAVAAGDIDSMGWSTRARLDAALQAMRAHTLAASGAEQIALANLQVLGLSEAIGSFAASCLATTDTFKEFVRALTHDHEALRLYNEAVSAEPDAGVPPLDLRGASREDHELPLWVLDERGRRRGARVRDALGADLSSLRPRGLVMTGLLRLYACDLFIHGLGGGLYDRATERWFASLGRPLAAPMIVVSADLFLPGEPETAVTARDVDEAVWRAHHARHHPGDVGDVSGAGRRAELLAAIHNTRRASAERTASYRELHRFLAERRDMNAGELAVLDSRAARIRAIAAWQRSSSGRFWPAFVYPEELLSGLRLSVTAAIGAGHV